MDSKIHIGIIANIYFFLYKLTYGEWYSVVCTKDVYSCSNITVKNFRVDQPCPAAYEISCI